MTSRDHASVCADRRIGDGTLWPIPITLDVGDALADTFPAGDRLALRAPEGVTSCARTCRRNWVLARGTATSNVRRIGYVASEIDALGPGREVVDEEPEERQVADRGDALRQEERPLFRGEGQGCDSESRSSSIANRK